MYKKSLDYILDNQVDYRFDTPFTHYVIDELFEDETLKEINDPQILLNLRGRVTSFNNNLENKIGISHLDETAGKVLEILQYLNSEEFISFLSHLTGIKDLIPDPEFNGGGVHIIPRGGKLGVHVDFSRAIFDETKYRRLNVLLYLNDNWEEKWGGALELWDKKPSEGGQCIKRIYPLFNRIVIFGTARDSWHGHPNPLECPEGEYRKSLATYYYTSEPGDDLEIHSTIF